MGKRKEIVVYGSDYDTDDGSCIRDYIHVNDLANDLFQNKGLKQRGNTIS